MNQNKLYSYVAAARACSSRADVTRILDHLCAMASACIQGKPALFTVIFSPTGTGKTQLATTAALEKDSVRYLLCEGLLTDWVQPFYKPHNVLTNFLLKALAHFRVQFSDKLKRFNGANAYLQWFSEEEVSSPLVTLIHRILFPLNDIFTEFDSWIEFTRGTLEKPHQIAFLTLGANKVSWLTVEKGGVSLAPTEDT